jgi:hypothetical protein
MVQIILEILAHPARVEQTLAHIPPTATEAEHAIVRDELDASMPWDLAIMPVKEVAGIAAGTVVLGLILLAFGSGKQPRYSLLFTLCAGLAGIGVLEKGAEILLISFSGQGSGLPVFPWSALAVMEAPSTSYATGLLLTTINLFTLWYVGALAWALAVLCNISKAHAVLTAVAFRAVTAGCAIAVLHLLRNAYAFTF